MQYYPLRKKSGNVYGTLHVLIEDLGIHLRGILATHTKTGPWRFFLPQNFCADMDTGNKVRYPILTFEDKEKYFELMKALEEVGREYLIKLSDSKESKHDESCKEVFTNS